MFSSAKLCTVLFIYLILYPYAAGKWINRERALTSNSTKHTFGLQRSFVCSIGLFLCKSRLNLCQENQAMFPVRWWGKKHATKIYIRLLLKIYFKSRQNKNSFLEPVFLCVKFKSISKIDYFMIYIIDVIGVYKLDVLPWRYRTVLHRHSGYSVGKAWRGVKAGECAVIRVILTILWQWVFLLYSPH